MEGAIDVALVMSFNTTGVKHFENKGYEKIGGKL